MRKKKALKREGKNTKVINNKTKHLCTVIFPCDAVCECSPYRTTPTPQTSPVTLSIQIIYTMSIQHIKRFFHSDPVTSDSISPFGLICWMSELQSKPTITT